MKRKLDVISQLDKGERVVDIWRNVRFACINVSAIRDNGDRIAGSVKSGTKVFV
jgi:hypothetical protein